jgi:hypothetical protein
MVELMSLWLPIVVAAVLVFVVSSITHVVIPLHKNDYARLPGESKIMEAMRNEGVSRGDYMMPHCGDAKGAQSEEMKKKYAAGPTAFLTVFPPGPPTMGKSLILWFVYTLVVGFFVAYLASRTLTAGADYLQVFRISGTAAFLAYAAGQPVASIWKGQKWSTSLKFGLDGLLYSLVTAGAFGWLWPK